MEIEHCWLVGHTQAISWLIRTLAAFPMLLLFFSSGAPRQKPALTKVNLANQT